MGNNSLFTELIMKILKIKSYQDFTRNQKKKAELKKLNSKILHVSMNFNLSIRESGKN